MALGRCMVALLRGSLDIGSCAGRLKRYPHLFVPYKRTYGVHIPRHVYSGAGVQVLAGIKAKKGAKVKKK